MAVHFARRGSQHRQNRQNRPIVTFRPCVEQLESRLVPYTNSGNAWIHPELITISFVPDGTNISGYSSDLVATFNAKFGSAATWQNVILKAAQTWAKQTNINFAIVSDNGAAEGTGSWQQGDPAMGDIRIGGFNMNSSILGMGGYPAPANTDSGAGDVTFNTGQPFNINGTNYDLFTVAAHEIGHALGLGHSAIGWAEMYGIYTGAKPNFNSDDISGIRNIYSSNNARAVDSYDTGTGNGSFANATDITSLIDPTAKTALVTDRDITTTADLDYYKFTSPSGSAATLTVTVQSAGLSLLAPTVYVYNSSQAQIGTASGLNQYGTTLTVNVSISSNQLYYVKVVGADGTVFGTGKYALTLNMGTGSSPTVPLPNTQVAAGSNSSGGVPIESFSDRDDHDHGELVSGRFLLSSSSDGQVRLPAASNATVSSRGTVGSPIDNEYNTNGKTSAFRARLAVISSGTVVSEDSSSEDTSDWLGQLAAALMDESK